MYLLHKTVYSNFLLLFSHFFREFFLFIFRKRILKSYCNVLKLKLMVCLSKVWLNYCCSFCIAFMRMI